MVTLKEKTLRLASATRKLYDFLEKGGAIKSREAVPVAQELVEKYADLAKEFGCEILKSIKPPFEFGPSGVRRAKARLFSPPESELQRFLSRQQIHK
jgi:hypothetical protein